MTFFFSTTGSRTINIQCLAENRCQSFESNKNLLSLFHFSKLETLKTLNIGRKRKNLNAYV